MKVLIIMPRFNSIGESYIFPVGICYISASLKTTQHTVSTLNLNHEIGMEEAIRLKLNEDRIDLVAVGGLISQYKTIKELVDLIKEIKPNVKIILGGGLITGAPEVVMHGIKNADYGIIGEGEYTICKLVDAVEKNESLDKISGIVYREGLQIFKTEKPNDIKELAALPWPDYEGFELRKYLKFVPPMPTGGAKRAVSFVTSRSCTHNCTFCFHTSGKTYRQRPLDDIFKEMEFLVSEYKIDFFDILDEIFDVNEERTREICLKLKKLDVKWSCCLRVNKINAVMIKLFKECGCVRIGYGIESMDDRILESMQKYITQNLIENALRITEEEGISIVGNLIFGDIQETMESVEHSLNWWKNNRKYDVALGMIKVYPGTYLYKYAIERGIIIDELDFIEKGCPLVNVSKLTDEQYINLNTTLDQYALTYTEKLKDIKYKNDKNVNEITIQGVCSKCETLQEWKKVKIMDTNEIRCEKCGRWYRMTLIDLFKSEINNKMESLIKNGKIAFWGRRTLLFDLITYCDCINKENAIIVDQSPGKQGGEILEIRSGAPGLIKDENIFTVIVTCAEYMESIRKQVKKDYPNVNQVISMYELL